MWKRLCPEGDSLGPTEGKTGKGDDGEMSRVFTMVTQFEVTDLDLKQELQTAGAVEIGSLAVP